MSSTDGSGRGATVNVGTQTVSEKGRGVQVVVGGTPDPRRRSIPNDPGAPPFTGRRDELAALDQAFAAPESSRVFVLYGRPGVGKSRLAIEYALTRRSRYPGGTFFVRCDVAPPSDLAKLLPLLGLSRAPEERIEDQCLRVLHHLGARPTLLVYDNVPDANGLLAWLPPAGTACHVLATSTFTDWPPPWQAQQVYLFPEDDARVLVGKLLTTTRTTAQDVEQVVRKARGITVELCAGARNIEYEARHGRAAALHAALASDTESSFAAAWRLLSADAQLLLRAACMFAIGRILPDALQALLTPEGWDEARFHKALDAVRDRGLLAAPGEMFELHQLVAAFVQRQATPELPDALVERHLATFVAAAEEYGSSPGDAQRSARLLAYPLELDFWAAFSPIAAVLTGCAHVVGYSLVKAGHFDEALPWYSRTLEATQKGDMHGRINHESVSASLHNVGACHFKTGRFDEALPFFKRAVEAMQKGDIHERVDQDSLGRSLHEVGNCHFKAGRFDEALRFFERAVEATQKGDIHGRVDQDSLLVTRKSLEHFRAKLGLPPAPDR